MFLCEYMHMCGMHQLSSSTTLCLFLLRQGLSMKLGHFNVLGGREKKAQMVLSLTCWYNGGHKPGLLNEC